MDLNIGLLQLIMINKLKSCIRYVGQAVPDLRIFTIYEIILDTEQYKGESEEKPQTVHLYNIQEKSSGTYADNAYLKKPDDNNIIPNNVEILNPNVNNNEANNKTLHQPAKNFDVNKHIENVFDDSVENITDGIKVVGQALPDKL